MTASEAAEPIGERQQLARLATVDADGSPRVVPVWYLPVEGALLITPREQSVWLHNLRRTPRVGVVIDEDAHPYRKVVVSTTAEILHEPGEDDAWRDIYRRIARRYWDDDAVDAYFASTTGIRRPLISVPVRFGTPEVRTWRLPVAGEEPRGIWAARYGPVTGAGQGTGDATRQ